MQERAPGPNDRHFVMEDGKLVQKPGLGADEPSAKARAEADAAAERVRQEAAALETAKAAVRQEAAALEARAAESERLEAARQAEYDRRMTELEERERAAMEREQAAQKVMEELTAPRGSGGTSEAK